MSKEKKLLITTIILAAMLPISAFGLSFISEAFIVLGMFCGISAMLCLLVYLDLQEGKKPKWIPIGLGMAFFGFIFLGFSDFYPVVSIPLSVLYAIAGLLVLAKGIKAWHDGKRNRTPKGKKRMNKKVWIGIGLLVGGIAAGFLLFNIYLPLMGIGHVMIVAGLMVLVRGAAQKGNGANNAVQTTKSPTSHTVSTAQVKVEYCARCGKKLTYLSAGQIFSIEGVKYCADCKAAIEQERENQHMVCSVCGVDLPIENMHVIDDTLLCHSCFLKKYGNIDPYVEEETDRMIDAAVVSLRKQIIAQITKEPAVKYELASLLWQDAASCFPKSGFQWDGAWFKLDLQTGKLSADVGTYPNQFGASYEDSFPLSAANFNGIAKRFHMRDELQAFHSDEDWAKLFDEKLKAAVSSARAALHKEEVRRKDEATKKRAVKIPAAYAKQTPAMSISEITIEISQRYSERSVKVSNAGGNYQVVYVQNSHLSPSVNRYPRTLSAAEAVWLEKQVESTIKNPDESTWQSLPGGDTMHIVIKRNTGKEICFRDVKPIRKYSDLQSALEDLAEYGSMPAPSGK